MHIITQNLTSNLPITITLASLANAAVAVSNVIDNATTLYIDADVQIKFKTGASVSGTGTIDVYILRCIDGGTNFDDSDPDTATLVVSFAAKLATTSKTVSVSIDVLPSRWKLMIVNNTGGILDVTPANFKVIYEGKKLNVI